MLLKIKDIFSKFFKDSRQSSQDLLTNFDDLSMIFRMEMNLIEIFKKLAELDDLMLEKDEWKT